MLVCVNYYNDHDFYNLPGFKSVEEAKLRNKVQFDESGDDLTYAERENIQQVIGSQANG
ncbi:MAG: hypothetical protein RI564_09340 [Gracilimonas sp.]|nr:hypothetical protein [Gracilimonas sp.]